MSYLGIKKRQGIPIVREGEAKPLNTKWKNATLVKCNGKAHNCFIVFNRLFLTFLPNT